MTDEQPPLHRENGLPNEIDKENKGPPNRGKTCPIRFSLIVMRPSASERD